MNGGRHPKALTSLAYAACSGLAALHTLWLYAMGYYRELITPMFITLLLFSALLLHCGRAGSPYGPRAILLASAYLSVSSALHFELTHSLFWLGLPMAASFVLLPHWIALGLNLVYTPLWWLLIPIDEPSSLHLFGYLAGVLMFALPPCELARRQALLRAFDPNDSESDAYHIDTLKERLSNEYQRATLLDKRLTVLVLHLSQLDMAEEQFGSVTKKALLKAFCSEINSCCRDHDLLGRVGSACFWLVLPDTSKSGALLVRERLYRAFSKRVLIETGSVEARIEVGSPRPDERLEGYLQRLECLSRTLQTPTS